MGASSFRNNAVGTDIHYAFRRLVENAEADNDDEGYSGTIAEKSSFVMSKKPARVDPEKWYFQVKDFCEKDKSQKHYDLLKEDFEIYDDKWGPALCIPTKDGFIFCGFASE